MCTLIAKCCSQVDWINGSFLFFDTSILKKYIYMYFVCQTQKRCTNNVIFQNFLWMISGNFVGGYYLISWQATLFLFNSWTHRSKITTENMKGIGDRFFLAWESWAISFYDPAFRSRNQDLWSCSQKLRLWPISIHDIVRPF